MLEIFTTDNLIALLTLTTLEIILGIDNVIFIAILSNKLPTNQQARGRTLGIALAVISRIALLFAISWVMRLTAPLFSIAENPLSGRDLILLIGGLFLIAKSTHEIHEKLEGEEHAQESSDGSATMVSILIQIMLIDVVFSLDSVITAVGISGTLWVMITAIIISAAVMLTFAGAISKLIEEHPTLKILALAFLIMIGAILVIEGWNPELVHNLHLKNYIYFAMAFSLIIEIINIQVRRATSKPVHLRKRPTLPESH